MPSAAVTRAAVAYVGMARKELAFGTFSLLLASLTGLKTFSHWGRNSVEGKEGSTGLEAALALTEGLQFKASCWLAWFLLQI